MAKVRRRRADDDEEDWPINQSVRGYNVYENTPARWTGLYDPDGNPIYFRHGFGFGAVDEYVILTSGPEPEEEDEAEEDEDEED